MSEANQQDLTYDLRGQICPSTLLRALKEMNAHRQELKEKAVRLVFKTTNRDSTVTIPDAACNMGYEVTVIKEEEHYIITIESR